ncbi:hypothetical protein ACHQM5_011390 [Ranunculus cassubicifolius]
MHLQRNIWSSVGLLVFTLIAIHHSLYPPKCTSQQTHSGKYIATSPRLASLNAQDPRSYFRIVVVTMMKKLRCRTGSGKSIETKQSSIAKALAVLGDDDFGYKGSSKGLHDFGGVNDGNSSMGRT